MASFRTHVSFGLALGILSVIAASLFALAPDAWSFFAMLCLSATVGAVAPDMDSDSGVPFHVTFASLSVVAASLALVHALHFAPGDYARIVCYPLGAAFVVWAVVGAIFKKFTRHRGMAHSVPAAALAGLLLFHVANRAGFDGRQAFLLGVAMTAGYLLHLLLDELYAAVNFHGRMFVPNKAFGSALKLFSQSTFANVCVYGGIVYFAAVNAASLIELGKNVLAAIS